MLQYGDVLKRHVADYDRADILELGAGRRASFTLAEMPSTIRSYTVNDISPDELALLAEGYDKACFNVSGDASNFASRYDVVFSRFLAEHVPDGAAMHRNVYSVLKPGGMAFHLIPTLYAMPFVINKLLPERLTAAALAAITPRRAINPKFPAHYSECFGTERVTRLLNGIGYSKVEVTNFYGHFYYEKIGVIHRVQEAFAQLAADRNWRAMGTYAYIKAWK